MWPFIPRREPPEIEALFLMISLQMGEPPKQIISDNQEDSFINVMNAAQWQADFNRLVLVSGVVGRDSVETRSTDANVGAMLKRYIRWYKRAKPVRRA